MLIENLKAWNIVTINWAWRWVSSWCVLTGENCLCI